MATLNFTENFSAPDSSKEFYLEYHDAPSNSHKWYAGLGSNGKFVIAYGRMAGYGRSDSISISNPTEEKKDTWASLTKKEKQKLRKGYDYAGKIPTRYKSVMMQALGVKSLPSAPTPAPAVKSVFQPTPTPSPISPASTDPPRLKVMLALDFMKHGHKIEFPAIAQRKLDGVRCLSSKRKDDSVILQSRQNNAFHHLDHIREDIRKINLPPNIILDGELYSHAGKLTFQKLAGLVRRQKLTDAEKDAVKEIRYHVYDMINLDNPNMSFEDRHRYLSNLITKGKPSYIDVVQNFEVKDVDEADKLHSQFVMNGYEGLMFRNKDSPYQGGRSKHLQKYKKFDDDEFEIVGYEEASGKDAGSVKWVLQTEEGNRFTARPKGTLAERTKLFNNAPSYIGKMLTVKYFGLTDGGIPRFPIGITIRDYEAETFAASRRKRKPLNQTGVFNWWDETALWALKYDWVKLILLENPEKSPYDVMRTTRNDTRKCPSCATRRYSANRENYGATVEHRNDGVKKFNYDSCNCGIYDTSGEKRREKEVKKQMLRRGLVGDMDKVHPDIQPAAAKWYLKKASSYSQDIPYWFHREYSHPTFFQRLRKRFTHRRGYSDWMVREREKYMSENFSAPFMDITFQDTPIQVKHLYHGQHTVDGAEITPHSPYWTTDLELALGHALFGAEQEVTGADLLICALCDGTHTTAKGEMCYSCDEDGYVLRETFTDDILPQTTPLVLSLDFEKPQTLHFRQDMEHDAGVSYLVESEKFNWSFVPADTLLSLLYSWEDNGLPELVEFDTGAGYVEHESSVTKRIKQAIQQLEQSAG